MMRKLLVATMLGLGLLAAPAVQQAAQALPAAKPVEGKSAVIDVRRRGGGFRRGGMGFRHGGWGGRRGGFNRGFYGRHSWNRGWRGGRRWRGGRGYFYGGPVIRFGYYGGNRCGWLRRRAVYTGSRYWWRRYQNCRYYYY